MIGLYAAMFNVIIMVLVNTINVSAQSQNETNKTDIGENQSGRISGLEGDLQFGR
jgi:hypothetical protein